MSDTATSGGIENASGASQPLDTSSGAAVQATSATDQASQQTDASRATHGSDATADPSATPTDQAAAGTEDDPLEGIEEGGSVPYERFRKVIEQRNQERKDRETLEAAKTEAERLAAEHAARLAEADPALQRLRNLPELKPYLDAGVPLPEALARADQDVIRTRSIGQEQQGLAERLDGWLEYLQANPEDTEAFESFKTQFKPFIEQVPKLKTLEQDAQQAAFKFQADATIEGLMRRFEHADREVVQNLVYRGDLNGAEAAAGRAHTAHTTRMSEMSEAIKVATAKALAEYQASEKVREETPVPAGARGGDGEPATPTSGLTKGWPDADKDPKGYIARMDEEARKTGRRQMGYS